jgi:hypothetical protein
VRDRQVTNNDLNPVCPPSHEHDDNFSPVLPDEPEVLYRHEVACFARQELEVDVEYPDDPRALNPNKLLG